MRLTLRTLLAWLDDTLPPAEVRQIGQQVNESPFAKELVERIHRVTRQRRLTVPGTTGADSTDPALVAAYLDNELSPEQVAEFEKKCLTSDVHLAEVASCHQILSLIGQRAKVPAEARHRMHHLIRGREAVGTDVHNKITPTAPEPAAATVPPWTPPEIPTRSAVERYGPAVAVVGLMAVLVWSALTVFGPGTRPLNPAEVAIVNPPRPERDAANKNAGLAGALNDQVNAGGNAAVPNAATQSPAPRQGGNPPADGAAAAEKGEENPGTPRPPQGSLGLVSQTDGILLRDVSKTGEAGKRQVAKWERLAAQAPVRDGDDLVNLTPFRSTLQLGDVSVNLVRDTHVKLRPSEAGAGPHLELIRGRIVVHATTPPTPVTVSFAGLQSAQLVVTPPAGGLVGIERNDRREPSEAEPSAPSVTIFATDDQVLLKGGATEATLSGPGSLTFHPPSRFSPKSDAPPPGWVSDPNPSPVEQQLGKQFAGYFKDNLPLETSLLTALVDDSKDVRPLAMSALALLGQLKEVAMALSTKGEPATRRAAIRVLRDAANRLPAKDLQKTLEEVVSGPEWSSAVEKLLIGFSAAEAKKDKTYERLVGDLKNPDIGIRELAIDNLETLTGRDALGYDPDHPDAGYKAWKDLLDRKELVPKGDAEKK